MFAVYCSVFVWFTCAIRTTTTTTTKQINILATALFSKGVANCRMKTGEGNRGTWEKMEEEKISGGRGTEGRKRERRFKFNLSHWAINKMNILSVV